MYIRVCTYHEKKLNMAKGYVISSYEATYRNFLDYYSLQYNVRYFVNNKSNLHILKSSLTQLSNVI